MQEKITYINRTTTDKQGNALMSKQGKPYTRLSIKVESKGDRFISGFGNQSNEGWKVGDEVDVLITESTTMDKNGKPYLNFSQPKKGEVDGALLKEVFENTETILNKMVGMGIDIEVLKAHIVPKKKSPVIEEGEVDFDEPAF